MISGGGANGYSITAIRQEYIIAFDTFSMMSRSNWEMRIWYINKHLLLLLLLNIFTICFEDDFWTKCSQLVIVTLLLYKAQQHLLSNHLTLVIYSIISIMIATKRIFIVKKIIVVSQNRTFHKVKKLFAKIIQTRRNIFAIFIFIIIDDDDLVKMFETLLISQNIVRLRVEFQREEKTQRVETIDIIEINELKIKINQLQIKRDISMLQHHAHDEESFEDRRSFLH